MSAKPLGPDLPMNADTRCVVGGEIRPRIAGSVVPPVFLSTVWEFGGPSPAREAVYPRYHNTPAHTALAAQLAALEGGEAAVVAGSGMSAIMAGVLACVRAGERVAAIDTLYGGTLELFREELPRLGIEVDFLPAQRPEAWKSLIRPGVTRLLYAEPLTNPLIEMPDLEAIVALARQHGLVAMIDNTFPTPINLRPIELGFDVVMHSATKYLNGHSDLNAGVLVGRAAVIKDARRVLKRFGGSVDPFTCFLLGRGLKTLALRMARHNENGLAVARFLEGHPAVARVRYPGLASHPQHERAARLLRGGSGMVAFELKPRPGQRDAEVAEAFLSRLRLISPAASLGGVETIVSRPAAISHVGLTPEQRAAAGIGDGLLRLSVGIEDARDLIADLDQALA